MQSNDTNSKHECNGMAIYKTSDCLIESDFEEILSIVGFKLILLNAKYFLIEFSKNALKLSTRTAD